MAGSNWDYTTVDEEGKDIIMKAVKLQDGVTVTLYKNELHIEDENKISIIKEGNLTYKRDLNIIAKRGPQQGIFFAVWWEESPILLNDSIGLCNKNIVKGMVGCGVYGYKNVIDILTKNEEQIWIGVSKESINYLNNFIQENRFDIPTKFVTLIYKDNTNYETK